MGRRDRNRRLRISGRLDRRGMVGTTAGSRLDHPPDRLRNRSLLVSDRIQSLRLCLFSLQYGRLLAGGPLAPGRDLLVDADPSQSWEGRSGIEIADGQESSAARRSQFGRALPDHRCSRPCRPHGHRSVADSFDTRDERRTGRSDRGRHRPASLPLIGSR